MTAPAPRPAPTSRRTPAQRPTVRRAPASRAAGPSGGTGYGSRLRSAALTMFAGGFLLLTVFLPSAALLAFIGVMPTVMAWIAEAPERRGVTMAVGALNLAGVGLAIFFFLLGGAETGQLARYLSMPSVWAGMYGSAAIGWGLFMTIPPIAQAAERYKRRQRLGELRRFRRRLAEEWGEEVAGRKAPRPPDPTA